jgi:hypothetical protein
MGMPLVDPVAVVERARTAQQPFRGHDVVRTYLDFALSRSTLTGGQLNRIDQLGFAQGDGHGI